MPKTFMPSFNDIEELKQQFGGKYKRKNPLLNYFLDNFYKDINTLVSSFAEKDNHHVNHRLW